MSLWDRDKQTNGKRGEGKGERMRSKGGREGGERKERGEERQTDRQTLQSLPMQPKLKLN